ncbi:hypothetical protein Tco_0583607 [Tanacetum coccineum]
MEYLPQRRWSSLEKKRANIMIKAIDKQLKEMRMMRSLEKFIGLEVGWIWRIHVLDTAYCGFLGVGTTFDIFQNIILIPYLEYGVLSPLDTAY